jgi:hypothetical protein
MLTKEISEVKKEIEKIEQEHINFCGYKASECGCCSDEINRLKKEENKNAN